VAKVVAGKDNSLALENDVEKVLLERQKSAETMAEAIYKARSSNRLPRLAKKIGARAKLKSKIFPIVGQVEASVRQLNHLVQPFEERKSQCVTGVEIELENRFKARKPLKS
jgi:hypothetical protein